VITVETEEPTGIGLFVFTATALTREVIPSREGALEWIKASEVTELDLVEDLPVLIPHVLAMKDGAPAFSGRYYYDAEGKLRTEFDPV